MSEDRPGGPERRDRMAQGWRKPGRGMAKAESEPVRPVFAKKTRPPGRWLALYDGHCRICSGQARQMQKLAGGAGSLAVRSFQEQGALDDLPGINYAACMERMHLISPQGKVYTGAECIARVLARRRGIGWVAFGYYTPGFRQLADIAYGYVARNRYRLFGTAQGGEACSDACAVHFSRRES